MNTCALMRKDLQTGAPAAFDNIDTRHKKTAVIHTKGEGLHCMQSRQLQILDDFTRG